MSDWNGDELLRMRNGSKNELLTCADLLSHGFDVFKNVSGFGCDLAAWKNGHFFAIEVKSGTHPVKYKPYRRMPALNISHPQLERCDVVALVDSGGAIKYFEKPTIGFSLVYGEGVEVLSKGGSLLMTFSNARLSEKAQ